MHLKQAILAIIAVGIMASFFVIQRVSRADTPPGYEPAPFSESSAGNRAGLKKHPKLGSSIARLVDATQEIPQGQPVTNASLMQERPDVSSLFESGLLRLDDEGLLQVYISVEGSASKVMAELESIGGAMERYAESRGLIQARVPLWQLPQLAALDSVSAITPPVYGRVNAGSALTEGDALLDFNDVRADFGVDGAGITVGVISDGVLGMANAIALGDLPATNFNRDGAGVLKSTSGGVTATSFRADGDLEGTLGTSTGAEGVAILEIVRDIAPGAQLRFANFETSLDFQAAVSFLAGNSEVVIDDISFFNTPYDQTSPVSTNTSNELNDPNNPIRGYYTSVGNSATGHYEEGFVAGSVCPFSAPDICHEFSATADTTDDQLLGMHFSNPVFVRDDSTLTGFLSWDDAFGATTSDYDFYLYQNSPFKLVASSIDDNPGVTLRPTEVLSFTNNTGTDRWYDIVIVNFQGASPPHTLEMFVLGGATLANGTRLNFNTARSSVPAQADAGGGVVSVGAIDASDPGIDDIEIFSSNGPTNNLATKPDVTALDGVSVTGSGGFPSTFFGTSASAPHVAGLAALLLEIAPDLASSEPGDDPAADRAALRSAIVGTAVDLGAPGVDNTYGSGRVSGLSAAQAVAPVTTATCGGLTVTIEGTEGDDVLIGTAGDDVIAGLGGNDVILGRGGRDTICGGDGNDYINGGGKADKLLGNDGNDVIDGGAGGDTLVGGKGNDILLGRGGKDDIRCGSGVDYADGGTRTDTATKCETVVNVP